MVRHNSPPLPGKGKSSHRQPVSNRISTATFHFIYKKQTLGPQFADVCSRIRYRFRHSSTLPQALERWKARVLNLHACRPLPLLWNLIVQGCSPVTRYSTSSGVPWWSKPNPNWKSYTYNAARENNSNTNEGYEPNSRKAYGLEARPMQVVS